MIDTKSHKLSPLWRTSGAARFVITTSIIDHSSRTPIWQPPTDVFETENAINVQVEIAGMHNSEISLSLDSRKLVISGLRPGASEPRAYHRMEIPFGKFVAVVDLPAAVESEKITAVYQDGFLRIVLPKTAPGSVAVRDER